MTRVFPWPSSIPEVTDHVGHRTADSTPTPPMAPTRSKDVKLHGILIFTAVLVLVTIAIQLALGLWMAIYSNDEREEVSQADHPPGRQ